jgi:hypothetical protein
MGADPRQQAESVRDRHVVPRGVTPARVSGRQRRMLSEGRSPLKTAFPSPAVTDQAELRPSLPPYGQRRTR